MKTSPQTQTSLQREVRIFNTNADLVSNCKQESQPDLRLSLDAAHSQTRVFISNADPSQTRISVQTRITVRPAFHLKHGSQPDLHLTPNVDLSQTRVLSQAQIQARSASHLKCGRSTRPLS